jgi:hypothetical protein
MFLPNDRKLLLTICESADKYEAEFISVDINANIPYHQWFDGGNMWGNHTMEMSWEEVEKIDPIKFKGINEQNWKEYL